MSYKPRGRASCVCGFVTLDAWPSSAGAVDSNGGSHHADGCAIPDDAAAGQRLTLNVTEDEWGTIRFGIKKVIAALTDEAYLTAYESHAESATRLMAEVTALWERLDAEVRQQVADCLTREAQDMGLGYRREEQF